MTVFYQFVNPDQANAASGAWLHFQHLAEAIAKEEIIVRGASVDPDEPDVHVRIVFDSHVLPIEGVTTLFSASDLEADDYVDYYGVNIAGQAVRSDHGTHYWEAY